MDEYEYKISNILIEGKENIIITFPISSLRFFIEDKIIKSIYKIPVKLLDNTKLISLKTKNKEVLCSINKIKKLGLIE